MPTEAAAEDPRDRPAGGSLLALVQGDWLEPASLLGGFPSWAPATAPLGGSQGQSAHQAFLRLFLKRLFLASQSKGERGPLSVGGHGGLVGCPWQGSEGPLKQPQLRGHWQPISFREKFTEDFRRLEKNVETLDSFFAY